MEMEICQTRSNEGCRVGKLGICLITLFALCGMIVAGLIGNRIGTTFIGTSGSINKSDLCNDHLNGSLDLNELPATDKKVAIRLPEWPKPVHYRLKIRPDLQPSELTYIGNVNVLLQTNNVSTSTRIVLHSLQLNITNVTLSSLQNQHSFQSNSSKVEKSNNSLIAKSSNFVSIVSYNLNTNNETLEIYLNSPLQANSKYNLSIDFNGSISNLLSGFYRSTYVDENGKTSYIGMTQFQATDARRAFPCWDEPAFKATFDIIIVHWKNHTALSNMPIESANVLPEPEDDWIESKFQPTLEMSTYLLAWAVGELKSLQSNSTTFAIWSRPAVIQSAQHALELGPKVLGFYEEFFRISYPLPKTDMLAAPDFNAGAMENWGLITYRETLLLYEPQVSRPLDLYAVSSVVAHELAHQWFGNLVTMRWWDDLWLNEGFATYMSYEALEHLYPNWQVMHDLQLSEVQSVLRLDCLRSSHPISVSVGHPDEISEIFDHISYSKGASIIRMMVHFLGRERFRAGVSTYLQAFAFGNSVQDDLWEYLSAAAQGRLTVPAQPIQPVTNTSGVIKNEIKNILANSNTTSDEWIDVKKVMDSWTLKAGYPLVNVKRDYEKNTVVFSQQRFLLESPNNQTYTGDLWEVPITYTTASEQDWNAATRLWLHRTDKENDPNSTYVLDKIVNPNEWILVNLRQIGFYRVNYDSQNWHLLIDQLVNDHEKIEEQSRAQILNDMFALAEAGHISYEVPLNTCLNYLPKESSPLAWRAGLAGLAQVGTQLQRSPLFGKWAQYMRQVLTPLYNRLSFEQPIDQRLQDAELQAAGLQLSCRYRVGDCVSKAEKLFQQWKQQSRPEKESNSTNATESTENDSEPAVNPIAPNVRLIVYCFGIQQGEQEDWEFVWSEYRKAQVASERNRLLHSLKCTRVPWLLVRLLHSAFAENGAVKKQDGISLFRSVASQDHARDIAFNFLRQHWSQILARYGKSFFSFGRLIASISTVNTEFELRQMLEFHRSLRAQLGSAERAFQQAIESIQANVRWMRLFYPQIGMFLFSRFGELSL